MVKRDLTPAQRFWGEVLGYRNLPRANELDSKKVRVVVESLPEREREVALRRFGFKRGPRDFEGIGSKIPRVDGEPGGVSRERVRYLYDRALDRLYESRGQWQKWVKGENHKGGQNARG